MIPSFAKVKKKLRITKRETGETSTEGLLNLGNFEELKHNKEPSYFKNPAPKANGFMESVQAEKTQAYLKKSLGEPKTIPDASQLYSDMPRQ